MGERSFCVNMTIPTASLWIERRGLWLGDGREVILCQHDHSHCKPMDREEGPVDREEGQSLRNGTRQKPMNLTTRTYSLAMFLNRGWNFVVVIVIVI